MKGVKLIIGSGDFLERAAEMNGELESANPAAAGRISEEPHPAGPEEVTQLLANWSHGDHAALEKLIPLVYEELRRLSHHYMEGQRSDHTLQTTALVTRLICVLRTKETKLYEPVAFLPWRPKRCARSWLITQKRSSGKSAARVQPK